MLSLHNNPYSHGHIFEKIVKTQAGVLLKLTFIVVVKNGEHKAKLISASQIDESTQPKITGSVFGYNAQAKQYSDKSGQAVICLEGASANSTKTSKVISPYISFLNTKISSYVLGQIPRAPTF